jgi:uncharacterized BrkB/YihY/UPF0761 family membrane protein
MLVIVTLLYAGVSAALWYEARNNSLYDTSDVRHFARQFFFSPFWIVVVLKDFVNILKDAFGRSGVDS